MYFFPTENMIPISENCSHAVMLSSRKKSCVSITLDVSSTLRTLVTDTPLLTSVSAIHPPRFAENAIVSQGKTQKSPDSVRLNFST